MERRTSRLKEFINYDIGLHLERWKYNPQSIEDAATLNELFRLVEKMELKMDLEIRRDAVKTRGDSARILPQEAVIYGEEKDDSWLFPIPPKIENYKHDPYILYASLANDPTLVYFHKNHGGIAYFKPSDIVSITIK